MFEKLISTVESVVNGTPLEEAIDPQRLEVLKQQFAIPEVLPTTFDRTFEAWFIRIGQWGKVKITHFDPENRRKQEVSQKQFIDRITDDEIAKYLGIFKMEKLDLNKMQFVRSYYGVDGKQYTEKFLIEVELKPELKKGLW